MTKPEALRFLSSIPDRVKLWLIFVDSIIWDSQISTPDSSDLFQQRGKNLSGDTIAAMQRNGIALSWPLVCLRR